MSNWIKASSNGTYLADGWNLVTISVKSTFASASSYNILMKMRVLNSVFYPSSYITSTYTSPSVAIIANPTTKDFLVGALCT
jgi:hypothetical protein